MTTFTAKLAPHGANVEGIDARSWTVTAPDRAGAWRKALDLVGGAIGCADFAYRDLADGSASILDTVCGSVKVATLRLVAARAAA